MKELKTVKDTVTKFGNANYYIHDGDTMMTYEPNQIDQLIEDWGNSPVIEVGCLRGVHIYLFNPDTLTVNQCRKYLGITQKKVSEITGVPLRTLENWEAGVRKCPEYVRRLVVAELLRH